MGAKSVHVEGCRSHGLRLDAFVITRLASLANLSWSPHAIYCSIGARATGRLPNWPVALWCRSFRFHSSTGKSDVLDPEGNCRRAPLARSLSFWGYLFSSGAFKPRGPHEPHTHTADWLTVSPAAVLHQSPLSAPHPHSLGCAEKSTQARAKTPLAAE